MAFKKPSFDHSYATSSKNQASPALSGKEITPLPKIITNTRNNNATYKIFAMEGQDFAKKKNDQCNQ